MKICEMFFLLHIVLCFGRPHLRGWIPVVIAQDPMILIIMGLCVQGGKELNTLATLVFSDKVCGSVWRRGWPYGEKELCLMSLRPLLHLTYLDLGTITELPIDEVAVDSITAYRYVIRLYHSTQWHFEIRLTKCQQYIDNGKYMVQRAIYHSKKGGNGPGIPSDIIYLHWIWMRHYLLKGLRHVTRWRRLVQWKQ